MYTIIESFRGVPATIQFSVIASFFSLVAILGYQVSRRPLKRLVGLGQDKNEAVGVFGAAMLTFFGVLASLIIVMSWENFLSARQSVTREATLLGSLYRNTALFPEEHRERIRADLREYVGTVISEEFDLLKTPGQYSIHASRILNQIQENVSEAIKLDDIPDAVRFETFGTLNAISQERINRISISETRLPPVIWSMLLASAALCFVSFYFYEVPDSRLRYSLLVLLALFTSLLIFVIFNLESPFQGDIRVDTQAFQTVLSAWTR